MPRAAASSGALGAGRVALDPQQPRDLALLLVDVELVVWPEGAQRHAEQAEDANLAAAHGQAQRAHAAVLGHGPLGEARRIPQRGQVGQPRAAHLAGSRGHRSALSRRVGWWRRPAPSPGSSNSPAMVATRRWKRVSPGRSGGTAVAIAFRSRAR